MTPSAGDPRVPPTGGEPDGALELALASVPRPTARAEFKTGLRRNFLSAARGASTIPLVDVVEEPRKKGGSRGTDRRVWAALLAAAAVVVAMLAYMKPRDSRWKVVDGPPAGIDARSGGAGETPTDLVYVDGVAMRGQDHERLEKSLVDAHEIRSDGRLRLRFADWYLLELAPHTRLALTPVEQRSRPEPLAFQVEEGALRVCTGPAFRGEEMHVTTEDASLRVAGTIFAVDVFKDGTCICCLQGTLKVTVPKTPAVESVDGEHMFRLYRDGRSPKRDTIPDAHSEPLRELEKLAEQLWP